MRLVAPLIVVDYFVFAAHPSASARHAARHVAHRAACHRLLEEHVWFEDRWMVASLCDEFECLKMNLKEI
jgi:hypothetical protein